MKTTGWMKNLMVYWRYYWGRLRGHDMRLWGRPGTARFKCMRLEVKQVSRHCLTKQEFTDWVKQSIGPQEFVKMEAVPCDCGGKDGFFFIYQGQKMDCPGWRMEYKEPFKSHRVIQNALGELERLGRDGEL